MPNATSQSSRLLQITTTAGKQVVLQLDGASSVELAPPESPLVPTALLSCEPEVPVPRLKLTAGSKGSCEVEIPTPFGDVPIRFLVSIQQSLLPDE